MIEKLSTWSGFEPGTPATTPAGLHIQFIENAKSGLSTLYRSTRLFKRQIGPFSSKAHKSVVFS